MPQPPVRYNVGTDVGGTFTDVVAHDPNTDEIVAFKVPSSAAAPARGMIDGLRAFLGSGTSVDSVIHGTTVATNAILERRGARTALVTTRGFRDVLEIARQARESLYDLRAPGRPEPLVPRDLRFEIGERVSHAGEVLVPLHLEEVPQLLAAMRAADVEAVAICLLHSYAHPAHERALRDALRKALAFVTASSDLNAEYREYERTSTTVLNAYLLPLVSRYVDGLLADLREVVRGERVHVMRSNGGMMSVAAAKESPLATVMSGPAGGVAACSYLAKKLAIPRALAFDMGGTSTDVCLIQDGRATVSNERRTGGHPFRLPTVAVESIGAGGGSIAWVDPAGALKVGPQSAGSDPGPACYGQGGTQAAVTDANMVLGYLNPLGVLGGRIAVERWLSETALAAFQERFRFGLRQVAEGIVEVANSNMLRALRVVSVQKGFDLRDFTLIAFGGAGPIHAGRLAEQLSIPRVIVPALSSVFSAFGCLVADLRYDLVQAHIERLDAMRSAELEAVFADMRLGLARRLDDDGYRPEQLDWRRSLDVRYVGQKYELEVALAAPDGGIDLARLRAEFDRLHRLSYSYATAEPVECVNARVSAVVPTGHPDLPLLRPSAREDVQKGKRPAYFGELGEVPTPVYDRTRLVPEQRLRGPAIVEDDWSTTVVYPGHTLTVDQHGNLIMEARG